MSTVVAIGETHDLEGFVLAGVAIVVAESEADISNAWRDLAPDAGLVILSPKAARTLQPRLTERPDVLTAVMP